VRYRPLGRTGLFVSELGLGSLTFGRGMGAVTKVDQPTADRMVSRALDAGVNVFDSADSYSEGQAEEILGRALGARRDDVLLATKVGARHSSRINDGGLSYSHVVTSVEASLRRLGTDWIDLLQIAEPDPDTPFEETAQALDDLVRRGLVRYLGFCDMPAWEAALALGVQWSRRTRTFAAAQTYYSLVGRDAERDLLPLAARVGLGTLVSSPLAGGFLTGKYDRHGGGTIEDRRTTLPYPHVDHETGHDAVDVLRAIAGEIDATPAQVALAWLLGRPHVTCVLLGASSIRQLYENIRAGEIELDETQRARLDAVTTTPAPHAETWRTLVLDEEPFDEITLT